jgi:hypothetical protein
VLFELAWTLRGPYGTPPERILAILDAVVALPGLEWLAAQTVQAALTCSGAPLSSLFFDLTRSSR